MISNATFSNFHLYFANNFLLPEVVDRYDKWFKLQNSPFINIESFLADSITSADIPGISTQTQTQKKLNGTERVYAGSLSSEASITKKISMSFKIKNNYFAWYVLRTQIAWYIDRKNNNPDYFLPPIYLDIVDDSGNIMHRTSYSDIVMESISNISFQKNSVGIQYKEFNCVFRYTTFHEDFNIVNDYVNRDEKYTY